MKTDNSTRWAERLHAFPDDYVALSPAGAAWMVERGVRLVGADFLSVEVPDAPGHPTHVTLLSAGVVILEGLDLSAVAPGSYELVCLPLPLAGCDGAPARAVLIGR
jgi:Predicted metal-dependent hydrolase